MEFAALKLDRAESSKAVLRASEKMMGCEPQQWLQNPMWSHDHAESFMKVMSSHVQTSRILNKKMVIKPDLENSIRWNHLLLHFLLPHRAGASRLSPMASPLTSGSCAQVSHRPPCVYLIDQKPKWMNEIWSWKVCLCSGWPSSL